MMGWLDSCINRYKQFHLTKCTFPTTQPDSNVFCDKLDYSKGPDCKLYIKNLINISFKFKKHETFKMREEDKYRRDEND